MRDFIAERDPINVAEVNGALEGSRLRGAVRCVAVVDSTNRLALEAAATGETLGVWVADEQTAGRGRGGHHWHSAPGDGLYVSLLYTPALHAAEALKLSLAAGLAAQEAIESVARITVDLRWPNDLVTYGQAPSRKLGGVLVETAIEPETPQNLARLRHAVIGIGINVSHRAFPPDLEETASSLLLEGWRQPDRQALLIALLERVDWNVGQLEATARGQTAEAESVLARLAQASTWIRGKRVRVGEGGGYTGVTAGLDPHGFLLVENENGGLRTVRSGGVREADPSWPGGRLR